MKISSFYILIVSLLIVLSSCSSSLSKEEFMSWMQDEKNGLKKSKTVGHLNFSLQYRTHLYDCILKGEKYEPIKEDDPLELYTFQLELDKKGIDVVDYLTQKKGLAKPQILEYFSSHFERDIYMKIGEDKKAPLFCQFERSFDLKGHRLFVLAFKLSEEEKKEDRLVVFDSQLLGVGKIKLRIRQLDITNIPELKQ